MTEAEWLVCTDPTLMLEFLRGEVSDRNLRRKPSDRKLRLFAVACCYRLWPRIKDKNSRRTLETAEKYADGAASYGQLVGAWTSAERRCRKARQERGQAGPFAHAILSATSAAESAASYIPRAVLELAEGAGTEGEEDAGLFLSRVFSGICQIARDSFGPLPFRPVVVPPAVLNWNDGTVPRIAQAIYEDRRMPEGALDAARLAILADALLDAGCDNEELIAHCRNEGAHVRGCWAIDLILGKG
jgi:hypothetical protein